MKKELKNFLEPKSIAVVGASETPGKVGYILMKKLENFQGDVIPINIKKSEILGRKAYASVKDYAGEIDLVVIATPAKTVKEIVKECGKKGIKSAIVISAGFSEMKNLELENEVVGTAKSYGMHLIGPNCFGVANPYLNLDTTFAKSSPEKGDIAFISQSGALWSYIADLEKTAGFSGFVSLGNMSDLCFTDFVEYFSEDKRTKKIVLYVEKLKHGRDFIEACRKCKKEIVVVKAGKTREGSKAALSHTGSLATDYAIYKGAFAQAGVKVADSIYSAIMPGMKEEKIKFPEKNKRIVVVTNAGGAGALISDHCKQQGFDLANVQEMNCSNPIDLLGTASERDYQKMLERLKKDNSYDFVVVSLTPQEMTNPAEVANVVVEFSKSRKVIACFLGDKSVKGAVEILKKNKIPVFTHCC